MWQAPSSNLHFKQIHLSRNPRSSRCQHQAVVTCEVLDGSLPVILLGSEFGVKPVSHWSRRHGPARGQASKAVLLQVWTWYISQQPSPLAFILFSKPAQFPLFSVTVTAAPVWGTVTFEAPFKHCNQFFLWPAPRALFVGRSGGPGSQLPLFGGRKGTSWPFFMISAALLMLELMCLLVLYRSPEPFGLGWLQHREPVAVKWLWGPWAGSPHSGLSCYWPQWYCWSQVTDESVTQLDPLWHPSGLVLGLLFSQGKISHPTWQTTSHFPFCGPAGCRKLFSSWTNPSHLLLLSQYPRTREWSKG